MFRSCSLHESIVGFFTIRQKRIRGESTYAECNTGPLKEQLLLVRPCHCLTATPGYARHNRLSAAGQTPHTVYIELSSISTGNKAAFTLGPVPYRTLANRTRRVDLASGLHSHYERLTRRERYASTSPCTHCVCFATGCDPITCT